MKTEREKLEGLPKEFRPMSAWGYVGYGFLFSLSIVGFVIAIVFSFDESYIARRNYARSYLFSIALGVLLGVIIVGVVVVIAVAVAGPDVFLEWFESIKSYIEFNFS